jgi:hypothetical protein
LKTIEPTAINNTVVAQIEVKKEANSTQNSTKMVDEKPHENKIVKEINNK